MIYPIVAYGDPVLKQAARDIEQNELDLPKLVEDMFETMYQANGVGLAAPQIGKSLRVFVIDPEPMDEENLKGTKQAFVNPTLVEEYGDDWPYEEGCLSIPKVHETVERAERLTLHYFDENWQEHEKTFDGMVARVIQHEYDHIEGVLFTDYLSPLRKRLIKGKLNNISRGKVSVDYLMRFPKK